jgi:hypothetical protein
MFRLTRRIFVKSKNILALLSVTALVGTSAVVAVARETKVERKGVVSRILMNPEGDADGLLLDNGTQVKFPPHMSKDLRATVAEKDAVTINGVEEKGQVVRADTIKNEKSGKSIKDTPPTHAKGEAPPPPPPGGPGAKGPHGPGPGPGPRGPREGLAELSVQGKITHQLFGPRGNVDGVILNDGAIVHVGPRALDNTKASLDVGKQIEAKGFGTKNEFGQSIEATELKNL